MDNQQNSSQSNLLAEATEAIAEHRRRMNMPTPDLLNEAVSPNLFAVFDLADSRFETYTSEVYKAGNVEAYAAYEGQNAVWDYRTLDIAIRSESEFVVSSHIDFSLGGKVIMCALCMEVFRKEDGEWHLLRQYMEKFRP